MSKTVKETFRDAISEGDWNQICRVFTAMTGEVAPVPPTAQEPSLDQLMDSPMDDPLDQPMEDPDIGRGHDMAGSQNNHLLQGRDIAAEDDLIAPEKPTIVIADRIPDDLPAQTVIVPEAPPQDDPAGEFYLKQKTFDGGGTDDEGRTAARRESMSIPVQRENRFRDNGKAFADEKVTNHPNNPKLGIQSIRPRGNREADQDIAAADTGKKVDVVCSLCKKPERISAMLAQGWNVKPEHNTYRCNECSTPKGHARALRKQREEAINGGRRQR